MNMDSKKAVTAEDLIRRYKLENLKSDRKTIQAIKENANNTNNLLNNFIEATLSDLQSLQDQVDGNIATWFFSGVPTLENLPAMDWTTDEDKNNHLGDLYYDKDTGYAYRFTLDNNVYSWIKLSDSDIAEALAIANAAQDTADSKRRVFVTQPTPPYDVGDIWIKEDTDLYRCRASRSSGNFNEVDWILATDYSNDDYAKNVEAVLNQFKTEVATNYATKVQLETTAESIEASVQSITTLTNTLSQTYALVIEDGYESDLLGFSIIGNMSLLYPSNDLYPSDDLYPLDSYLIIEDSDGNQNKIHLPLTYLNYLDANTYDEFVIENGQANIIRRVGVSEGGVLYPLETEIVEYKGLLTIGIKQGYNKIWLESFYDYELEYSAKYLYQSDYTTTFAPRVEMNSVIEQTAAGINSEVSKKVGKNEIISTINQSAESVTINANKVNLTGYITASDLSGTGQTVINGSNIKTGTIDASQVNITNLNANNITSGTISANKISGGTLSGVTIRSSNYSTTAGTEINLNNGKITTHNNFVLDSNNAQISADGTATFSNISIDGGLIDIDTDSFTSGIITRASNANTTIQILGTQLIGKNGNTTTFSMIANTGTISGNSLIISDRIEVGLNGEIECFGTLYVQGAKNRVVTTENYGKRLLNAYETAVPYFGDLGSNKTDENGYCKIKIEDIFKETIELNDYKVFIQECGEGKLYVKKHDNYFEVIGTANLDFDWELKAIQKGYANVRLTERNDKK